MSTSRSYHGRDASPHRLARGLTMLLVCSIVATAICHTTRYAAAQSSNLRRLFSADEVIAKSADLVKQAANANPADRKRLFADSKQLLAEWVRLQPNHHRLFVVRAQGAIASSVEAELARQQAELSGDETSWNTARTLVRSAITEWKTLATDINTAIRDNPRIIRLEPGQLTPADMASLEQNCHLHLAKIYREQALCYRRESADHLNALMQANTLLASLRNTVDPELALSAQVEELSCRRILGDIPAAKRILQTLSTAKLSADLRSQVLSDQIRLAVDEQDARTALALATPQPAKALGSGNLELARLEAFLFAWKNARSQDEQSRSRQVVIQQVRSLREAYPGYWSRRAEELVAASLPNADEALGIDTLAETAASRAKEGNWQDALSAYDRAIDEAKQAGDANRAFTLGLTAAQLIADHKDQANAGKRFRSIALTNNKQDRSAEAHLLAIHYAGVAAQQSKQPRLDEYHDLLEEHLTLWPRGKTTDQARWQLGKLLMLERRWQDAIQLFNQLPVGDLRFADLAQRLTECRQNQANELERTGQRDKALALIQPLAAARPDDGALQEQFARLLANSRSPLELEKGVTQWFEVQKKSKPGSARWFRATYGMAKTQHDLGRDAKAAALIKRTEFAYPSLGGEELRAQFIELLKICDQSK